MSNAISTLSQQQISSLEKARKTQLLQPLQNWQNQIKNDQAQLSAWGKVSGAISSLSTAADKIADPAGFNNRSATVADPSVASATVSKNAAAGQYSLSNIQIARSQELYSQSYASGAASIGSGSGSLTITLADGDSETVNVTAGNATLDGIAQAINQQTGGAVSASLVGGSSGERLVLTGNQTGSDQSFTVSGTGALSTLNYPASGSAGLVEARAARSASLKVNGVPVSSQSNTLTGVIPDGSVTLTGSGSTSISVNVSASKLSDSVSSVISKLNGAVSTIQKATAFQKTGSGSSAGSTSGPLLGDYSATSLGNKLVNAVSGLSSGSLSARDIGITTNKDGSVSFDSTAFAAAFKNNPDGVNALVSQLHTQITSIAQAAVGDTGQGFIAAEKNSLNQSVSNLRAEIRQQNDFANQQMKIYIQQFARLQSQQNAYQVQNNYLSLLSGGDNNNDN